MERYEKKTFTNHINFVKIKEKLANNIKQKKKNGQHTKSDPSRNISYNTTSILGSLVTLVPLYPDS